MTRLVCYCKDCQAYARYLGQAEKVLGPHGGTEIAQLSPANLHVTRGRQHLAIVQLSEKGIFRWYAQCCNTPVCNTPRSLAMPFLGLLTSNLLTKRKSLDELLGPVCFGVCAGSQYPIDAPWPVSRGFGFKSVLSTVKNMGRWRLAGDHMRSELIDADTGLPSATPLVLSADERQALYR